MQNLAMIYIQIIIWWGGMLQILTFERVGTVKDIMLGCAVLCCGNSTLFYKHL